MRYVVKMDANEDVWVVDTTNKRCLTAFDCVDIMNKQSEIRQKLNEVNG